MLTAAFMKDYEKSLNDWKKNLIDLRKAVKKQYDDAKKEGK
jgi:hypothetical protein